MSPAEVKEMQDLQNRLRSATQSMTTFKTQLAAREARIAALNDKIKLLRSDSKDNTEKLHTAEMEFDHAVEEGARLRNELVKGEQRHQAELKGLAKQIMFLKQSAKREMSFRKALAFQKTWFLLNIQMYNKW
jgi:septal ring factor EnvC (AmiA/AmiB activator)